MGWGSGMASGGSMTACRVDARLCAVPLSGQREPNFHQILRRGIHLQGSRNPALGSALTPFPGLPSPNQPFSRSFSPGDKARGAL